MSKETKTVQCYPSDDRINAMVERYASFGWELINNQRCQEYTGQTFGSDGSSTEHYSTFNKLTFTREKSSPWYGKVTALENEYNALLDKKPTDLSVPPDKGWLGWGFCIFMVGLALALVVGLGMGVGALFIAIGAGVAAVGVLFFVVFGVKKSRCKREYREYRDALSEWERTSGEEAKSIMRKADALVNG